MSTGAVIIAAGITSHSEGFLPMKPVGKLTRAQRVILNFRNAGIRDIVIVTGSHARELEHSLKDQGVVFLYNQDYASTEMFDSAKIGFRYMKERCSRVLFTTVNVTLFTQETVRLLLESRAPIAIPVYGESRGHPVMLSRQAMERVLTYTGEGGLRRAIDASGLPVDWIQTEDPGILKQSGEDERFGELLKHHNSQLLHMELDVGLVREKPFFDSKTAALLEQILMTGSVRSACARIGVSYSKGFQMLDQAEEELGFPLTRRQQGGRTGGTASLTGEGREFLEKYENFRRRITLLAAEEFRETFGGEIEEGDGYDSD